MAIGDADITAILASGDFDVEAVFTRAAGGTVTTRGIFTDATQQTNMLTAEIETVNASISVLSTAISTIKQKDTVVISSVTYQVARIEKTGMGMSLVYLKT